MSRKLTPINAEGKSNICVYPRSSAANNHSVVTSRVGFSQSRSRASIAFLAGLVCLWGLLFALTWAHWGDLTIDCGREMYVPAQLAQGKVLYRDVWYPYTPGAPYLNSLLFRLFGVHLNVLYWAGGLSALACALLLYLSGIRLTRRIAAFAAGAILLLESFEPDLFCFPLPYSFGTVYGCVAAFFCLWCMVNACWGGGWKWIFGAGIGAAAALLAKLEFGAGCYGALGILIAVRGLRSRSWRRIGADTAALAPGVIACAAAAAWMCSLKGADFIVRENFMSWPSSYFMKRYGAVWLAFTGLAISKDLVFRSTLAVLLWFVAWTSVRYLLARLSGRSLPWRLGYAALGGFGIAAHYSGVAAHAAHILFFPRAALYLVVLTIPLVALWFWRRRSERLLAALVLFFFAALIAPRTLFATQATVYSVFYNGPVVLSVFVILGWLAFPRGLAAAKGRRWIEALPYLAAFMVVLLDVAPLYRKERTFVPLATDRGVIYTKPQKAQAYREALAFVKEAKREGAEVLSVPEDMSLYFLTGAQSPSRLYQFGPGVLEPGKMTDDFIASIDARKVRYVIWSNRTFYEYGVPRYGTDYDQPVAQYFRTHYAPLRTIGSDGDWQAVIWERKAR